MRCPSLSRSKKSFDVNANVPKITKFVERVFLYECRGNIAETGHKYIKKADENSLRRVNAILEIDQASSEWWKNKEFAAELDSRYEAMESGKDKGVTVEELKISIEKIRSEMYGK